MKRLRQIFESIVYAGLKPRDPFYLSNRTTGQRIRLAALIAIPCLAVLGGVALAALGYFNSSSQLPPPCQTVVQRGNCRQNAARAEQGYPHRDQPGHSGGRRGGRPRPHLRFRQKHHRTLHQGCRGDLRSRRRQRLARGRRQLQVQATGARQPARLSKPRRARPTPRTPSSAKSTLNKAATSLPPAPRRTTAAPGS